MFKTEEERDRWLAPVKESAAFLDALSAIGSDLGEFACEANLVVEHMGHANFTADMPGFTNLWVKIWDYIFIEQNSYNIGRITRAIHSHY